MSGAIAVVGARLKRSVRHTLTRTLAILGAVPLVIVSCTRIEPVEQPGSEADVYETFFLHQLTTIRVTTLTGGVRHPERIWVCAITETRSFLSDAHLPLEAAFGPIYPAPAPTLLAFVSRSRDSRWRPREALDPLQRLDLLGDYHRKAESHLPLRAIVRSAALFTVTKPDVWDAEWGRYHLSRVAFDVARRHALLTFLVDNGARRCCLKYAGAALFQRDGTGWKELDSEECDVSRAPRY
jgi:hypothetical protein